MKAYEDMRVSEMRSIEMSFPPPLQNDVIHSHTDAKLDEERTLRCAHAVTCMAPIVKMKRTSIA